MATQAKAVRLRLTAAREERGWSRRKLGQQADLDGGVVGKIEAGRLVPYPVQLARLARALKVPVADAASLMEPASD